MNTLIAEIAVDKTFFSFDTDYSYAVPAEFADKIEVGYDVKVPFGAGNVLRSGIVVALKNGNTDKLKFIHSIDKKVLIDEMVSLALWLRER